MPIVCSNEKQRFSKECLYMALMIIMKKKNINEITVKELVDKAGLSRMAFYRNYHSIYEIIEEHLEYDLFGGDLSLSPGNFDPYKQILSMFTYIKNNENLIQNVISSNLTYMLLKNIEKMCDRFSPILNAYNLKNKYEVSAFTGMLYKIIIDWAKDGMKETPKEITDISFRIMIKIGWKIA